MRAPPARPGQTVACLHPAKQSFIQVHEVAARSSVERLHANLDCTSVNCRVPQVVPSLIHFEARFPQKTRSREISTMIAAHRQPATRRRGLGAAAPCAPLAAALLALLLACAVPCASAQPAAGQGPACSHPRPFAPGPVFGPGAAPAKPPLQQPRQHNLVRLRLPPAPRHSSSAAPRRTRRRCRRGSGASTPGPSRP